MCSAVHCSSWLYTKNSFVILEYHDQHGRYAGRDTTVANPIPNTSAHFTDVLLQWNCPDMTQWSCMSYCKCLNQLDQTLTKLPASFLVQSYWAYLWSASYKTINSYTHKKAHAYDQVGAVTSQWYTENTFFAPPRQSDRLCPDKLPLCCDLF